MPTLQKTINLFPIMEASIWRDLESKKYSEAEKKLIEFLDYFDNEEYSGIMWQSLFDGIPMVRGYLSDLDWQQNVLPMLARVILETSTEDEFAAIYKGLDEKTRNKLKPLILENLGKTPGQETNTISASAIQQNILPTSFATPSIPKVPIKAEEKNNAEKPLMINLEKQAVEPQKERPGFMSFNMPSFLGGKKVEEKNKETIKAEVLSPNNKTTLPFKIVTPPPIKPVEKPAVTPQPPQIPTIVSMPPSSAPKPIFNQTTEGKPEMMPIRQLEEKLEPNNILGVEKRDRPTEAPQKSSSIFSFFSNKNDLPKAPQQKVVHYSETRSNFGDPLAKITSIKDESIIPSIQTNKEGGVKTKVNEPPANLPFMN